MFVFIIEASLDGNKNTRMFMRLKTENNSFIRFLKDEKFIEWKLFPTDELDRYWKEYLLFHPEDRIDIELAEKHFRKVNISSYKLAPEKKREAMRRMQKSLDESNKKRRIRRFSYGIAASFTALIIFSVLYIQNTNTIDNQPDKLGEYIVGSELESEDILFISGDRTSAFQSNVDILIDEGNTARVKHEDKEAEKIIIEQQALNRLIVPYGKRSKVILADGTRVWLNSGSTLEFPGDFSHDSREVFLTGEMYIEVEPDNKRPFHVRTSDFNVRVYGTKFNVSSYTGSRSSVVLAEGSIGLQSTDMEELILSPNELATYSDKGVFDTRIVDATPFISWKDGYLTFDDTPVTDALKQIERYYNLSFDFDDSITFQGLTCTGKIILSDNLDNVMTTLSLISETKFKREGKLIYIYKRE